MVTGLQVSTLTLLTGPYIHSLIIPAEKGEERLKQLMACNPEAAQNVGLNKSVSRMPALTTAVPGLQQQQQQ